MGKIKELGLWIQIPGALTAGTAVGPQSRAEIALSPSVLPTNGNRTTPPKHRPTASSHQCRCRPFCCGSLSDSSLRHRRGSLVSVCSLAHPDPKPENHLWLLPLRSANTLNKSNRILFSQCVRYFCAILSFSLEHIPWGGSHFHVTLVVSLSPPPWSPSSPQGLHWCHISLPPACRLILRAGGNFRDCFVLPTSKGKKKNHNMAPENSSHPHLPSQGFPMLSSGSRLPVILHHVFSDCPQPAKWSPGLFVRRWDTPHDPVPAIRSLCH